MNTYLNIRACVSGRAGCTFVRCAPLIHYYILSFFRGTSMRNPTNYPGNFPLIHPVAADIVKK
jgi:hypothetical protein